MNIPKNSIYHSILQNIICRLHIPTICVLCRHYHDQSTIICSWCKDLLQKISNPCMYCSLPLPDKHFLVCGYCLRKKPIFDRVITNYMFVEPLRTLIHKFKYQHALYLRDFLVQLMLEACEHQIMDAECLIPVPLYKRRLRRRGFNQASELAKKLSSKLKIAYDNNICKKNINTLSQVGLNAADRYANLRNSFVVTPIKYKYVVIVDDLITTGSTANEMAISLKNQGVERVDLICCARAIVNL